MASGVTSRATPVPPTDTTKVHPADHRGVQRVADFHLVGGHHDHAVDDEAASPSSSVTNGPLWSSSPCAVRSSTTTTSARPTNSPGCSMNPTVYLGSVSGSHCQRDPTRCDAHCSALPRVTCTVCGLPDGSRYVSVTLSPGAFDLTAATSASASSHHPVVDLGDHNAARQARRGGRAAAGVHDLRAVGGRVVADLNAKRGMRGGAVLDEFIGDALGLIDRDRETQPDRPALGRRARASPPRVAIAELTPTSSPFMLTNAPPELPGLIAASVWMASSTVFWFCTSPPAATGRFSALMMPVVTVPSSPSGEPIATTSWPTRRFAEEPNVAGVRPETPSARTTAMSLLGSVPTTVNGATLPSAKVTLVCAPPAGPPGASLDAETTWLLVKIRPSVARMIPEPSSDARPMSTSSLTTLGTTFAATCSTEPTGTLAAGTEGAYTADARRGGRAVVLRQNCHSAADAGRDDRDCQGTSSQSACARTLLGRAGGWPGGGCGAPAVRVVGCAELLRGLLRRIPPVVRLLVRARPLRSGVSGARLVHRRRAARPDAAAAVSTSGDLSCRCGALPQVGSDIHNNDACMPTVPNWAENPLREPLGDGRFSPVPPL